MARRLLAFPLALFLLGCPSAYAPPVSPLPSSGAAIERMRATAPDCTAIQAAAKIDRRGEGGRVAGDLMMIVQSPQSIRMDVVSFGTTLATLTSDSKRFALMDLREKRFFVGPARACNIARFTRVPIAGTALVELLRGQAPLLKGWKPVTSGGQGADASAPQWNSREGHYVVVVRDDKDNEEEIRLAPHPDDLGKPWNQQRMRVVGVTVTKGGLVWYRAELGDHAVAPMGKERVDPEGVDPPMPPSGPMCTAEIPRRILVEVPWLGESIRFRYDEITWNPPIPPGLFQQTHPPGTELVPTDCEP